MKLGLYLIFMCALGAQVLLADVCASQVEGTLERFRHGTGDPALRRFVRMRRVPQLREELAKFLRDESKSPRVKRMMKKALDRTRIDIRNLDADLRHDWNIPETSFALAEAESPPAYFFWNPIPKGKTINEYMGESIRTQFNSPLGIAVPEHVLGQPRHSLLSLVHELSHIYLDALLHAHFERLVDRLPDSLARRSHGKCYFNRQFLEYIHERYAREMTYVAFRDGFPDLFPGWDEQFGADYHEYPPSVVGMKISKDVLRIYAISDPQIIALSRLSLHEVLFGGGKLGLETDFIKSTIEAATEYDPLRTRESYLFVYATLAKAFVSEGQITGAAIGEEPALRFDLLGRITDSEDPMLDGIETLLRATDDYPKAQAKVIKFLSAKKRRRLIAERTGWHLSESDSLTLTDFISTHPDFGRPFKIPDETLSDPDFQTVVDMMAAGENYREPKSAKTFFRFTDAENAYHEHRRYVKTLALRLKLFRQPVSEIATSQPNLLARRRTIMKFWENLKLAEEFANEFPNQRIFRKADRSLLQIYLQLKSKKLKAG